MQQRLMKKLIFSLSGVKNVRAWADINVHQGACTFPKHVYFDQSWFTVRKGHIL